MILLHPMNYRIYLHDPSFFSFFFSIKAHVYTGLKLGLELKDALYRLSFSSIQHIDLDRESNPCEEDPDYNYQQCVKNSLARMIGCKLPWDKSSSDTFQVCSQVKDLKAYDKSYRNMKIRNFQWIQNYTGCKKPCQYREYRLVEKEKDPGSDDVYAASIHLLPPDQVLVEKELPSYRQSCKKT